MSHEKNGEKKSLRNNEKREKERDGKILQKKVRDGLEEQIQRMKEMEE